MPSEIEPSLLLAAFVASGFPLWIFGGLLWLSGTIALIRSAKLPRRSVIAILLPLPLVFLGARLHSLLLEQSVSLETVGANPELLLLPGFRMPGGLLLGLLAFPLCAAALRLPVRQLADAAFPFVGLFLAVGRIACWRDGCCYGVPSDLPWAITHGPETKAFMEHLRASLAGGGLETLATLHPLALYLSLAAAASVPVLLWLRAREHAPGEIGLAAVALLCLTAAGIENLRETSLSPAVPLRQMIPVITGAFALVGYTASRMSRARIGRVPRLLLWKQVETERGTL